MSLSVNFSLFLVVPCGVPYVPLIFGFGHGDNPSRDVCEYLYFCILENDGENALTVGCLHAARCLLF